MSTLIKAIAFLTLIMSAASADSKRPNVSLEELLDGVVSTDDMTSFISKNLGIRLTGARQDNYPLLSGPLRLRDVWLKNLAVDISAIRRKEFILVEGVGCKNSNAMIRKYKLKLSQGNQSHYGREMVYSGAMNGKSIEIQTDDLGCFRRLEISKLA